MKRILRMFATQVAIYASVSLFNVTCTFQGQAQASQISSVANGDYYGGAGYGVYPIYGQGPYAYGINGGNGYRPYGAGPYGYNNVVNTGTPMFGQYIRSYYGPNGIMTYHGSYGYGPFNTGK